MKSTAALLVLSVLALAGAPAFREKKVDLRGTETMLLRKTAGSWRIVHIHWSSGKAR